MKANWFQIQNKADAPAAEVLIYEQIGKDWFTNDGIGAKDFAESLAQIPKDRAINVRINSPGGNVWDGLAIYHQLKSRGEKVTTHVDGIAASIASVIALAGHKVVMPDNALMMIHRAWGMAMGNAEDMLKLADDLEKHDHVIAGIYSEKNGKSRKENLDAMAAETWFNGSEAKAFGLVDDVSSAVAMSNKFDLSKFNFKNLAGRVGEVTNATTVNDSAPAPLSAPCGAEKQQPAAVSPAALNNQPTKTMPENATPAAAQTTATATDFTPVINAINDLGEKLTKTANSAPGAAPLNVVVENLGNPAVEKYNRMEPGAARAAFRVQNHSILRSFQPKNANTIDSALIPDYLSDALITIANNKLAPLRAFSMGVGLNPLAPRQTVQVSLASAASTTLTNATNFEAGNSTLAGQPVTVDQYSQPFHLTNAELNQGIVIQKLAQVNANALANKISDVCTALMTATNFGTAVTIGTAANFSSTDLPPIWAAAKNFGQKNLLLDGGHLAYLLPTSKESFRIGEAGAYNFDLIAEQNRWTSAESNACGFVCGPDAICVATGTPLNLPSAEFLSQQTVTLSNGLSVVLSSWYSRAARNVWMCYDVMFGAGVGDATQAEVLITA